MHDLKSKEKAMKQYRKICAVIAVLLMLSQLFIGCEPDNATTTTTPVETSRSKPQMQATIDAVNALRPGRIPDYLVTNNATKNGTEFDVNSYFTALKHLSMEPGFVLDYVYRYDGMGGQPSLYVRKVEQKPFNNYSEYLLWATGENKDYNAKIRIDGTEAGYFEFALFQVIGSQFYLVWHANYNDTRIVCSKNGLQQILATGSFDGSPLPGSVKSKAGTIQVEPVITFNDSAVNVRVILFTKWGGFKEATFTINRQFPHGYTVKTKLIVEYQCGVMF
jgi:hypothetical protein